MKTMAIFSVRDTKVNAFMTPWFAPTKGAAIRSLSDAVNGDKDGPVAKHPGDYILFYVGEFDEVTGQILPLVAPEQVCAASDLIEEGR